MIGWIVAGAVVGALLLTAIDRFWNDIASWLNNTAANAVERALGYDARKFMQRAVANVSKLHDRLHNKTVVYTRQSALDTHIQRVTLSGTAPVYEQEEEVIEKIDNESVIEKTFEYLG